MGTPTYLGEAHNTATSVSFALPYGTEMIVIFAGYYDATAASVPTTATFNSVNCGRMASADSSAGSFETACGLFILQKGGLPAPGSSYTAAFSGGAGASAWINVAAFGGISNETTAINTDENIGTWDTALDGQLNDLMVGMLMVDDTATPTLSGGTIIYSANRFAAAYYIFTADAVGHAFDWSVSGTENNRDTSIAATFHPWKPSDVIWM